MVSSTATRNFLRKCILAAECNVHAIGFPRKKLHISGIEDSNSCSSEIDSFTDTYVLVSLIKEASDRDMEFYCRQIHSYTLKSGVASDSSVSHALLRFYKKCECPYSAYKVFVENPHPQLVSWNGLISCYLHCGMFTKALDTFVEMERFGLFGDAYTVTMAVSTCGHIGIVSTGSSLHCKLMKLGLGSGTVVSNTLIDMYGKCGFVEEAIHVFKETDEKDTITWNSVIAATTRNQRLDLACRFFAQMPNPDTVSYNQVIEGLSQGGKMEDALTILRTMPSPNSSSWNSVLTGYVNRQNPHKALTLFADMHSSGVQMDVFTYSVILSSIADYSNLLWGMIIHCFTVKCGLELCICVGTALIDMYSKCGHVGNGEILFLQMPVKNIVSWNAMMSGYAHSNQACKVITLFEEMLKIRDLKPDWITFLNLLTACSSGSIGLDRVKGYFDLMVNCYGITSTVEHCCSMIRIMGRSGDVKGAKRLIYWLGFGSCCVVWRALLGACGDCKELGMAKIAALKIIQMEGEDDYLYVVLSNILSYYCKWHEVAKLRRVMSKRGVCKVAGKSWMEIEQNSLVVGF